MKYTLKIFFTIRKILLLLRNEKESQLPLKKLGQLVKETDSLDLSMFSITLIEFDLFYSF